MQVPEVGVEPTLRASKAPVLPLDDSGMALYWLRHCGFGSRTGVTNPRLKSESTTLQVKCG